MAEGLVLFTEMIKQNPVLGVVVIVIIDLVGESKREVSPQSLDG